MLGIQTKPVLIEVIGWLLYLIPVGLYVAWPPGRPLPKFLTSRWAYGAVAATGVAAIVLAVLSPAAPAKNPVTSGSGWQVGIVSSTASGAQIRATVIRPVTDSASTVEVLSAKSAGQQPRGGYQADVYIATAPSAPVTNRPATLTYAEVSKLNGGRLPLGVSSTDVAANKSVAVTYTETDAATIWVEPSTGRVLDLQWHETVTTVAALPVGATELSQLDEASATMPVQLSTSAAAAVRPDHDGTDRHHAFLTAALALAGLAILMLLTIGAGVYATQRRKIAVTRISKSEGQLARS